MKYQRIFSRVVQIQKISESIWNLDSTSGKQRYGTQDFVFKP